MTDDSLLTEFLFTDSPVFISDLEPKVDVTHERVRQKLRDLATAGFVDRTKMGNQNVYQLTDKGRERVENFVRGLIEDQNPSSQ